jgi:hypothetical protein
VDPDDPDNDRQSFGAWLTGHGQRRQAMDGLWELIGKPTLNLRADDASLAVAAFVFRTGLLERADAGDIGYARTPLQRVHGDAAQRALELAGGSPRPRDRTAARGGAARHRLAVGTGQLADREPAHRL